VRPTLITHTGFDGSAEEMHFIAAAAAVERGYNVLTFDGPGQFGPIHREGLPFRPDWEKVVSPVVDFALARPEVDPRRIALMGVSMGGELAPRAAAFEPRLAALIANDGVYDYAAPTKAIAPPEHLDAFLAMLHAPQAPGLDAMLARAMAANPTARWAMTHGMYAMGVASPRAYVAASLDYSLAGGIAERIHCPTLVCDAEDDLFFKGQAKILYDHLTCPKTLISFTTAEGAGSHCQAAALRLANARILDWLDDTFGRRA
jgi:pimeloyl-ACP methyl ester carboxylesterase